MAFGRSQSLRHLTHLAFTGKLAATLLALMAALVLSSPAWACEDATVAQSLYQLSRDVHVLCVIADDSDPEGGAVYERLRNWIDKQNGELNLEVQRIAADDPTVAWQDYGLPSAPPTLPVVVMVARHAARRMALAVDRWEPAPTDEDLAVLVDSQFRKRLRSEVPLRTAVLVFSPGTGESSGDTGGQSTAAMLDEIVKRWAKPGVLPDQPTSSADIAVLTLDRNDPAERTAVSFAGIDPSRPDWLAVFAGKGKMLFPPMSGEQITRENLNAHIERLLGPCTCIESPASLGVDIPMKWGVVEQALVSAKIEPVYKESTLDEPRVPPEVEVEIEEVPVLGVAAAALGALACVAGLAMVFMIVKARNRSKPSTE